MEIFTKYLYIVVIIALIVVLVILFKELVKLMKKLAQINTDNITSNIEQANNKIDEITETKESYKTIGTAFLVASIINETIKDYKKTSSNKRKVVKSLGKTCAKNAKKLSKIRV